MKNIIKRGTSLLLVFAMLLSFAAVVGATDGETTTAEQILTLEVGEVPLKAGEKTYVPVYGRIKDGYQIACLNISVQCDSGITIDKIATGIPNGKTGNFGNEETDPGVLEGVKGSTISGEVNGIFRLGWLPNLSPKTYLKGTYTRADGSEIPYFWVVVTAAQDTAAGGYEIKLDKHPDTAKACVVVDSNGTETDGVIDNIKTDNGEAVVYPANAELPVVVLTKTTFDVPTMEEQIASGYKKGDYELNQYLKIVYQDGAGNVQMDDVSSARMAQKSEAPWTSSKVTFSTVNNKLSINPAAADQSTGTLTVTEATAKTSSVTYQCNSDVTFKVSKKASELTSLAFTNNRIEDNANISAPAQNTQDYVDLGLGLQGKDQYGVDMALTSSNVTVEFYSDSACANKIGTTPTGITLESNKIHIVCTLENDVWCKLTATGVAGEKTLTETVTFKIESTKPHAKSAEIVLKDVKGNQYMDSQGKPLYIFTIPAPGQNPVQIKIDAKILDQNKHEMTGSDKPGFTASAYWGTKDTPGTDIPETGVEASATLSDANVLEITSKALENLGSATEVKLTVEITVNGISDKITQEITLTKAASVAAYLASGESGTETNLVRGNIFLNHNVVYLPGINETKESLSAAYPVYVMDQYGQHVENDGKNATVPAANFKLYPATSAGESDEDTVVYENVSYKKNGNAIGSDYVKFTDNGFGGVLLSLKNDKVGNDLILDTGAYIVEATYPTETGTLTASCVIKLEYADRVPTTATVTASAETIYVPYASEYGTLGEGKPSEVTLRATVKDQYGDPITEGVTLAKVGNDIDLYDSNDNHVIKLGNNSTAAYVSEQNGTVRISVSEDLAGYMKRNGTVVTNGELRLPVKVTVGEGEHALTLSTTAKVKVSREASALKKATVVMKQGETEVESLPIDVPTTPAPTISRTTPKTTTSYSFAVTGVDQYGDELKDLTVIGSGTTAGTTGISWVNDQKGGYLLNVTSTASGEFDLYIQSGATKQWFYVKFAPMQFVKVNEDNTTTPYEISNMLDLTTKTYGYEKDGKVLTTWAELIDAIRYQGYATVNILNQDGTKTPLGYDDVKVVVKQGSKTVYDPGDTNTLAAKANAGDYTVYIVYAKDENDEYEVCHGAFKIEPKEIKLVQKNGTAIPAKEYDGERIYSLPTDKKVGDYFELETGAIVNGDDARVNIDGLFLQTEQTTVGENLELSLGGTGEKLTGEDAANYVLSMCDLGGATGTITKKKLDVYVEFSDKEWDGTTNVWSSNPRFTTPSQIVGEDVVGVNAGVSGDDKPCFSSSDVGATLVSGKTGITATLTGASAGNYKVGTITYNGGQATITKATLTITRKSGTAETTVYGQDTALENALAVSGYTITNSHGSTIASNAFSNTEAPDRKLTLTKKDGTVQSGNAHYDAGNYTLSLAESDNYEVQNSLDFGIRYIHYTLEPDGTISKEYDGTTALPSGAKFKFTTQNTGPSDETLKVKNVEQFAFADANKGESKTISVPDDCFQVEGGNANTDNYKVTANLTGTIDPKDISAENSGITVEQTTDVVYDGMKKTLDGTLLTVTDTAIGQNGGTKLWMGAQNDYTVNSTEGTDANEDTAHAADYQLTVSGQGNYTGTKTFNAKIKKYRGTIIGDISSTKVTRGKTTTLYINTDVVLKPEELEQYTEAVKDHKGVLQWRPINIPEGITVNVETTGDFKLKVTVTVENDITMTDPAPQFRLELSAKFPETAQHRNIVSEYYTNYEISVTDKEQQTNFKINEGGEGTYSYSKGGLQLTTSGKATDDTVVSWSIAEADQVYAEVNASGYVKFNKPGTVRITATASETDNFASALKTYTLTITKGDITVTASSATMTANDPLPGFSATASGLNPNDSVSEVFQTLTASVSTDGKTAGTFRVTPNAVFKTGVKDWNEYYELSFVQGTLTVNPAVSVIDTVLPTIIAGNGCANGYANCACESFYDLDASRWYHEAIDWAYNLGLMNGTTKSTFGPNTAATRAQTWTMLARIAGQDTRRSSTWYEVGQKWAMNLGITDGTNPMGSLTREQLAAMLYRYVGSPAVNGTLTFTDSANVSTWARNAMIWAVQNGILDGVGGNRLNPKGTTTRAQAAAIFMRFSKLINK